jgi:hypothetical protein
MLKNRSSRLLVVIAVVLILATAVYAFAASNTVPTTLAGEGAATISGYTVTNVAYNLNSTTPRNIDSVTFTLSAAATTVNMGLVSGTFYTCGVVTDNDWTCSTTSPQATVSAANNLDIIATDH